MIRAGVYARACLLELKSCLVSCVGNLIPNPQIYIYIYIYIYI